MRWRHFWGQDYEHNLRHLLLLTSHSCYKLSVLVCFSYLKWIVLDEIQLVEVKLITGDFSFEIWALAESTNPAVLQGSRDLSEQGANQISVLPNRDMVIIADMIPCQNLPPLKRIWGNQISEHGFREMTERLHWGFSQVLIQQLAVITSVIGVLHDILLTTSLVLPRLKPASVWFYGLKQPIRSWFSPQGRGDN